MPDNVLLVPIQLNGNLDLPYGSNNALSIGELLEREIYIIKDGVIYVGAKDSHGNIVPTVAQGRVVPNAELKNPKIVSGLTFGDGLVVNKDDLASVTKSAGKVVFVDEGAYSV
jgi:hypothetical protein